MEKMTRAQINERLEKLRKSRLNDESYTIVRPAMAMCYSISPPRDKKEIRICSNCGQPFEIEYDERDNKIKATEDIVEQFKNAGVEARFICNCPSCVEKKDVKPFEIWIKAEEETEWHKSNPAEVNYCRDKIDEYTSKFEYNLVLRFLTVPEQMADLAKLFDELYNKKFRAQELEFFVSKDLFDHQSSDETKQAHRRIIDDPALFYSGKKPINFYKEKELTVARALKLIKEDTNFGKSNTDYIYHRFTELFEKSYHLLTYKGIYNNETVDYTQDAGFIKTKTDCALHKVLGVNVVYDIEEMRKNIACIWESCGDAGLLPLAYKALEKTGKTQFTLSEYSDFMSHIRKSILRPFEKTIDAAHTIIYSEITRNEILIGEILSHLKRVMEKQGKYAIEEDKLEDYLHNEIFPTVRFDFGMIEKVFKQKHDSDFGHYCIRKPKYVYFENALEKLIAMLFERSIDRTETEKLKEEFMSEKDGILAPLYQREGQKDLSIQDIIDIQEEINQRFIEYMKPPRIGVIREKEEK